MEIFIDGDGCPVKKEIEEVATEFQLLTTLVTAYEHFSKEDKERFSKVVYVDHGRDSADYKILSLVKEGDLCVTQDYGLAALLIAKNVVVFHQRFQYTKENIEGLMDSRYYNQQLRKANKKVKGPKAFTTQDRTYFKEILTNCLQKKTP